MIVAGKVCAFGYVKMKGGPGATKGKIEGEIFRTCSGKCGCNK